MFSSIGCVASKKIIVVAFDDWYQMQIGQSVILCYLHLFCSGASNNGQMITVRILPFLCVWLVMLLCASHKVVSSLASTQMERTLGTKFFVGSFA
jgi:hypothetical protein